MEVQLGGCPFASWNRHPRSGLTTLKRGWIQVPQPAMAAHTPSDVGVSRVELIPIFERKDLAVIWVTNRRGKYLRRLSPLYQFQWFYAFL